MKSPISFASSAVSFATPSLNLATSLAAFSTHLPTGESATVLYPSFAIFTVPSPTVTARSAAPFRAIAPFFSVNLAVTFAAFSVQLAVAFAAFSVQLAIAFPASLKKFPAFVAAFAAPFAILLAAFAAPAAVAFHALLLPFSATRAVARAAFEDQVAVAFPAARVALIATFDAFARNLFDLFNAFPAAFNAPTAPLYALLAALTIDLAKSSGLISILYIYFYTDTVARVVHVTLYVSIMLPLSSLALNASSVSTPPDFTPSCSFARDNARSARACIPSVSSTSA